MTSDLDLLRQFARKNSQDAFAEIVRRHLNLVYSAARRQVRSPQLAEEIAQSVFADLARNAGKLNNATGGTPVLTAWLYAVTRRTAIDAIRKESRRQLREQIAVEMTNMNATANDWTQIEPLLDDAMGALDETDRSAILLRYFENKNLREVGETLGTTEDAAQKRVSRAVERLREFFSKRNVTIGAGGLAVLISANAVQSAPMGLAATISTDAVLAGTAVHTSTVTLGTLKVMTWAKFKMALGFSIGVLVLSSVVILALKGIYTSDKFVKSITTESPERPNDLPASQGMKNQGSGLKLIPSNPVPVLPSTKGNDLTAADVLSLVQQAYASLSTYRDSGWTVHKYGDDAWTNTFDQLLARPNYYRIKVITAAHPYIHTNVNWSAGDGDYFQLINADIFTNSSGLSGNVAAVSPDVTVPAVFFDLNNLSPLFNLTEGENPLVRQQDETVGGVDCYVLTRTNSFEVAMWIGKRDFLIRRWRSFLSREAYTDSREQFEKQTRRKPSGSEATEPITITETHENISVNEVLTNEEFTHDPIIAPVTEGK